MNFITDKKPICSKWPLVLSGVVIAACGCLAQAPDKSSGSAKVEVRQDAGRWRFYLNDRPFFIKGAGGKGPLAKLKEAGGNSVRTWGVDGLQSVLDEAHEHGLTVCVGIWLHHERDAEGFDYSKPEMVKAQLEQVRQTVLRFKDHPAVLLWGLGNEMEGEAGDKVEIWNAVEAAAKLTKELDPHHPTMTVIAEIGGQKVAGIHKYCPDIDIIGINSYGGGPSVAERYAKLNGIKPYIVTEFGPVGPWETRKTSWGAAYEPTSTEKASWYRKTYQGSVANQPRCLGSYAFLWGQKQETTATWFGMFLKDGDKLQGVDTMTELWSGSPPANPCPVIKQLKIRDLREFAPGVVFSAELEAADPGGQPLRVRWVVQPEQPKKLTAGAEEQTLPELTDSIVRSDTRFAEVRAPQSPGGYRLFAYVRNGVGAAVANVPFHVGTPKKVAADRKAKLPLVIDQAPREAGKPVTF
jgi:Glycosyl hydrolases family 2, TIM barrel domain